MNMELPSEIEITEEFLSLVARDGTLARLETNIDTLRSDFENLKEAVPNPAWSDPACSDTSCEEANTEIEDIKRDVRDLNSKAKQAAKTFINIYRSKADCNSSGEYHLLAGLNPAEVQEYKNGKDITASSTWYHAERSRSLAHTSSCRFPRDSLGADPRV